MDTHENGDKTYVEIRGPDGTVLNAADACTDRSGGRYADRFGPNDGSSKDDKRALAVSDT